MVLIDNYCPECKGTSCEVLKKKYVIRGGEERQLYLIISANL